MVAMQMEQLYNTGEEKLKPNTIIMNSAIAAWAKNGEGSIGALWVEILLQLMGKYYETGDDDIKWTA
eukprot:7941441-Ditylum_brightwellii.AAC.1